MGYQVSGRIKRKSVKDGRVSFKVADKWYSAFTIGKGVTQEFQDTMRHLMEGDSVELTVEDNQGKDGKVYSNIRGAVKVQDVNDDFHKDPDPDKYKVQSGGSPAHKGDSDLTRVRSMALAYGSYNRASS